MKPLKKTLNAIPAEAQVYMKRALRLAERARGLCSPNPFVGAVIVKNGELLGEGWTQVYGSDHAEVQALKKAGPKAQGADMYVSLEPCSHQGKTPPCTRAIIKAGIKRVYVGILDPNPLVNGRGIKQLRDAGIEVMTGLLAPKIEVQLESYLCRVLKQRPFVVWKSALSVDGKYAAQDGSSRWISGELSRKKVHRLREASDVVLTGIGTVLADDPMLNVRLSKPRHQPLRAVLDPELKLPPDSRLAQSASQYPTAVFCLDGLESSSQASVLKNLGIQIHPTAATDDGLDLHEVLDILFKLGHNQVLLESGSKLASAFFERKLVDKIHVFLAPKLIGGSRSILSELDLPNISQAISLQNPIWKRSGDDFELIAYPDFS
ncbi:MAG: bifunctional diaminohydroxyphosphoribosylaminopyrimidine deaminase/5-amino-6-(5-phosphoribosylamino)uracil reductase RibD [Candidatus Cloacimonetes bacterium]|nr:bifunctional diaminohydroxyphosphoribosylaminopyrimidine deaminase/5-amino-6-(5-phosphoribosylamino)uracil reductase RibD [Candidatus Cloacimonadota bacterium]